MARLLTTLVTRSGDRHVARSTTTPARSGDTLLCALYPGMCFEVCALCEYIYRPSRITINGAKRKSAKFCRLVLTPVHVRCSGSPLTSQHSRATPHIYLKVYDTTPHDPMRAMTNVHNHSYNSSWYRGAAFGFPPCSFTLERACFPAQ